jgi:carbonic anhydrase/acetyltransferase-like protein (isoleucine patch superfamily)
MPINKDVVLSDNEKIFQPDLGNLYSCIIGDETKIGAFVEVQKNAVIGAGAESGFRVVRMTEAATDSMLHHGNLVKLLKFGKFNDTSCRSQSTVPIDKERDR